MTTMLQLHTPASGSRLGTGTALPRAGRSGAAPLKNDNSRLFQPCCSGSAPRCSRSGSW